MGNGLPSAIDERIKLEHQLKSGANWFFWIAGLSVVNSLITMFSDSGGGFVIGLGITQIIDAIGVMLSEEIGSAGRIAALMLNIIPVGVFVVFGVFAGRRQLWAFIVGLVIYGLDGLLFLLVRDWWSIGFHTFALVCVYGGFKACRRLGEMVTSSEITSDGVGVSGSEEAGVSEER